MKTVTIPAVSDGWDPVKQEFVTTKETTLQLEHSLLSISKWESIWKKPFLDSKDKTYEESLSYYKCMTLTQNVPDDVYRVFPPEITKEIIDYINDPYTATTITHHGKQNNKKEIVTAEVIYYWMVANQIPFECQKWHLNRLLALIEVCSIKNNPEKMSKREVMNYHRSVNAARRAKYASKHR
jgi:hypothetical protein